MGDQDTPVGVPRFNHYQPDLYHLDRFDTRRPHNHSVPYMEFLPTAQIPQASRARLVEVLEYLEASMGASHQGSAWNRRWDCWRTRTPTETMRCQG
jgi:hypothetical protein